MVTITCINFVRPFLDSRVAVSHVFEPTRIRVRIIIYGM